MIRPAPAPKKMTGTATAKSLDRLIERIESFGAGPLFSRPHDGSAVRIARLWVGLEVAAGVGLEVGVGVADPAAPLGVAPGWPGLPGLPGLPALPAPPEIAAAAGPLAALKGVALPRTAAIIRGSLPSIPSAQMP